MTLGAARASIEAKGAWEPIETAPKDGTQILLCSSLGTRQIGWWVEARQAWSYGGGQWADPAITKWWQRLPIPPAPSTGTGEQRRQGHSKLVYNKATRTIDSVNLVGDKFDTIAGKIIADAELDEMRGSVLANLSNEIAAALRNAYALGQEGS